MPIETDVHVELCGVCGSFACSSNYATFFAISSLRVYMPFLTPTLTLSNQQRQSRADEDRHRFRFGYRHHDRAVYEVGRDGQTHTVLDLGAGNGGRAQEELHVEHTFGPRGHEKIQLEQIAGDSGNCARVGYVRDDVEGAHGRSSQKSPNDPATFHNHPYDGQLWALIP